MNIQIVFEGKTHTLTLTKEQADQLRPPPVVKRPGMSCDLCCGFNLQRTGPCFTCQDCGTSTGCG